MPIRKYATKSVVQGYTGSQLADDIKALAAMRKEVVRNNKTSIEYVGKVEDLVVGKACARVLPDVDTSLKKLFKTLQGLLPDEVVKSVTRYRKDEHGKDVEYQAPVPELQYKMGPLKKIERITEKAAHYAVCDTANYPKLQLQMVRDILRATMVFPPTAWGNREDGIGSKMIDAVNKHFKGAVVQVKNRFVHGRYPNFTDLDGVTLPADLAKFCAETFKQTLWGRDSFYRDIQLLIRIDNGEFNNGQAMDHTILELQLASSRMYMGKTDKSAKGGSGHDMYKNVRSVMEHCEYIWWRAKHAGTGGIKLAKATEFYDVKKIDLEVFTTQAEAMARLYMRKDVEGMSHTLGNAIDDSDWYKASKK